MKAESDNGRKVYFKVVYLKMSNFKNFKVFHFG